MPILSHFPTAPAIPESFVDTSDATAAANDILSGKTAYADGTKVIGTYVPSEGLDTSDATATSADILSGKTAYVDGEKLSGSMPNNGSINQSITQTFAAVPPKVSIPQGYTSGGEVDLTPLLNWLKNEVGMNESSLAALLFNLTNIRQAFAGVLNNKLGTSIPTSSSLYTIYQSMEDYTKPNAKLQTKTATPTKSLQQLSTDSGYDGMGLVIVHPIPSEYITTSDATAQAGDILNGKTAYVDGAKVTGTYVPSAELDTSDATAQAGDILSGKTAYVDGTKITGTLVVDSGGSTSGGINPFTVAYGTTLPDEVVQNQIFVITEQTPPAVSVISQSNYGITIQINNTDEPFENVIESPGSVQIELTGGANDQNDSVQINIGNGATLNTGISINQDNYCFTFEDIYGMYVPLAAYFGDKDIWMQIATANDDSAYSLRRARRT